MSYLNSASAQHQPSTGATGCICFFLNCCSLPTEDPSPRDSHSDCKLSLTPFRGAAPNKNTDLGGEIIMCALQEQTQPQHRAPMSKKKKSRESECVHFSVMSAHNNKKTQIQHSSPAAPLQRNAAFHWIQFKFTPQNTISSQSFKRYRTILFFFFFFPPPPWFNSLPHWIQGILSVTVLRDVLSCIQYTITSE